MRKSVVFIFLALVCFVLYLNCLNNEFLYDEGSLIRDNPHITSLRLLPHHFDGTSSQSLHIYRPVLMSVYSLCYFLFGLNPAGYHLVSVFLFALHVFLIYLFISKLFGNVRVAIICAVLFAVHPLHSKEVAIVADMPFLLEGVFIFSSLNFVLRYADKKSIRDIIFALIFFVLAVFSRESALLFFLIVWLVLKYYGTPQKRSFFTAAPFFLLAAAYFLLRQVYVPVEQLKIDPTDFLQRVTDYFYYCNKYVQHLLLVLPRTPVVSGLAALTASIITLLFYAVLLRLLCLKEKIAGFGSIFFLFSLLPLLNLTDKIGAYGLVVFEHYAYLASLGLILIFALFFYRLGLRWPKISFSLFSLTAITCAALTIQNIGHYSNEESYYRYILSYEPNSAFSHAGLANVYSRKGMLDQAQMEAQNAFNWKERKKISRVYTTLGSIYCRRGELNKGMVYYNLAISAEPEYNIAYIDLALVFFLQKKFKEAEFNFRRGLNLDPYNLFALENFSRFLFVQGRYLEAKEICARILKLRPDNPCAKDILAEISSLSSVKENKQ